MSEIKVHQRKQTKNDLPLRALHHVAIAETVADVRTLTSSSFTLLLQVVVRQPEQTKQQ